MKPDRCHDCQRELTHGVVEETCIRGTFRRCPECWDRLARARLLAVQGRPMPPEDPRRCGEFGYDP